MTKSVEAHNMTKRRLMIRFSFTKFDSYNNFISIPSFGTEEPLRITPPFPSIFPAQIPRMETGNTCGAI